MFLDLIDAHAKCLEVFHVAVTILHLTISYDKCLHVMACLTQWSQTMVRVVSVKSLKYFLQFKNGVTHVRLPSITPHQMAKQSKWFKYVKLGSRG